MIELFLEFGYRCYIVIKYISLLNIMNIPVGHNRLLYQAHKD